MPRKSKPKSPSDAPVRELQLTLTKSVVEAAEPAFARLIGECETLRLCFTVPVLTAARQEVEKQRQVVQALLPLVDQDDARCVNSVCRLARSLEHYVTALIALKSDQGHAAWTHLVDAAEHIKHSMHLLIPIQGMAAVQTYSTRIEALLDAAFPKPIYQSVSAEVIQGMCSICGKEILDCDHVPGTYCGSDLCQRIVKEAKIREISIVDDPHDRGCVVTELTEEGIAYDVFDGTKRVSEKNPDGTVKHRVFRGVASRFGELADPRGWKSLTEEASQDSAE